MEKVGKDGVITVEESKGIQTEVEYVEGMAFDRGYISPYFVTNPERMEAVIEDPYILITDKKISAVQDILPMLEKILAVTKNLVIICGDIEGEALATLAVNKLRGTINVVAVKAPGFGDRRKDNLGDLAALTGATVISEEHRPQAGIASTSPTSAAPAASSARKRRRSSKARARRRPSTPASHRFARSLEATTSDWDREKLQERLGKLAGSVAVIKVGAATEVELKEKKHRVEDALSATRAAVEEGIVPGGGVALINALSALDKVKLEGDEATGANILRRALEEPLRRIAINAGKDGSVIAGAVKKLQAAAKATTPRTTLRQHDCQGIIDPVKVTRSALENAVSIAGMVLTTNCLVTDSQDGGSAQQMPGY